MTVIFQKISKTYTLKLVHFPEDEQDIFKLIKTYLSNEEINHYKKIKNPKRKKEWCGTRFLLKKILGNYQEITYSPSGKPDIKGNFFISITHTGNYIGIIVSKKRQIGIDAEIISERILKTAHKFIPENELSILKEKNDIKTIYFHWCAKETLFKIKGDGGYDFLKDFVLFPKNLKEKGKIKAMISKSKIKGYTLNYHFINHNDNNIILVWSS